MKVAIFINDCPIQFALVNKISEHISIHTVFRSKNIVNNNQKKTFIYYVKRLVRIPFEMPFRLAWNKLKSTYHKQYSAPLEDIIYHNVNNINDKVVIDYIRENKPGLVIVSATTMVGEAIINEAEKINCLILNLHTGVSPYIKGGPNCTNWCLANDYYLIGNTVMKLDKGIDSGAIISTELTKLDGNESLSELHYKVMEHGFDLYKKVITCYAKTGIIPNIIPQDDIFTEGSLFYTKDWTILQVIKAYYHFLFSYKRGIKSFKLGKVKLVPFKCEEESV